MGGAAVLTDAAIASLRALALMFRHRHRLATLLANSTVELRAPARDR
ncbi:hypothetical protein [Nocardia vinacea]|nr:hypothetical protein [Nocardia vinacea]